MNWPVFDVQSLLEEREKQQRIILHFLRIFFKIISLLDLFLVEFLRVEERV